MGVLCPQNSRKNQELSNIYNTVYYLNLTSGVITSNPRSSTHFADEVYINTSMSQRSHSVSRSSAKMTFAKFLLFTTLATLAHAKPVKDSCGNFTLGTKFIHKTLSGTIWKTFTAQRQIPEEFEEDPFLGARSSWFYTLTPEEIYIYRNEMGSDFEKVNWENVKYSWNFDSKIHLPNFKYGVNGRFKFLIELNEGGFGDITAIPAGENYEYMKRIGAEMTTPRYRIREVGSSLAVVSCETHHKYLLTRDLRDPNPADVQLLFPS